MKTMRSMLCAVAAFAGLTSCATTPVAQQRSRSRSDSQGTVRVGRFGPADEYGVRLERIDGFGERAAAALTVSSKQSIKLYADIAAADTGKTEDSTLVDWRGRSGTVFAVFLRTGKYTINIYAMPESDTGNTAHQVLATHLSVSIGGAMLYPPAGSQVEADIHAWRIVGLQFTTEKAHRLSIGGRSFSVGAGSEIYADRAGLSIPVGSARRLALSGATIFLPTGSRVFFSFGKPNMVKLAGRGRATAGKSTYQATGRIPIDSSAKGTDI